jgi:hypothetical protein
MRKWIVMAAAATALSGLAVPAAQAAGKEEAEASAKVAVIPPPAPGMGQVVFFRPGKFVGSAIRCTVREDGKMVGRAGNGKYFVLPATPGPHRFTTKTEATDTLNVEVEPDETTYVKCAIGMGVMAGRPNLSPATAEDFGKVAHKIKLADTEEMAKDIAEDEKDRAKAAATAAGN